jgi:hypothetical protein
MAFILCLTAGAGSFGLFSLSQSVSSLFRPTRHESTGEWRKLRNEEQFIAGNPVQCELADYPPALYCWEPSDIRDDSSLMDRRSDTVNPR